MANFKKIDDYDFVFIDKPWTEKEKKEFSEFLKNRKKQKETRKLRTVSKRTEKQYA